MADRDIIVVGASAGGLDALLRLVRGLPAGLPASLFVACHLQPGGHSSLPEILSRAGPLLAVPAVDGEPFHPGQVYVAPPDYHLLLGPDRTTRLTRDARENRHRPAIDPLFRSAARHFGARTIGVVLSGALSDGAAGLMALRAAGGLAVVQDPADALFPDMPRNAVQLAGADRLARADELAPLLTTLLNGQAPRRDDTMTNPFDEMHDVVEQDMQRQSRDDRRGEISVFSCPECGGSLWQAKTAGLTQFRCHVGHVYNGEVLLSEQSEALEAALWTAVRTFREKSVLAQQLARHKQAEGDVEAALRFAEQAALADRYGSLIRRYILDGAPGPDGTDAVGGDSRPGRGPA